MTLQYTFNGRTYNTDDYNASTNTTGLGAGGARTLWNQLWTDIMTDVSVALQMTSTTSLAIGTGSKVFTPATLRGVAVGAAIACIHDASNAMYGMVSAVSSTQITVNVTSYVGSGTYATWTLQPSGRNGAAWWVTSGAPGVGVGADGDMGLDSGTGNVYQKAGGAWALQANLLGPGAYTNVGIKTGTYSLNASEWAIADCRSGAAVTLNAPSSPAAGTKFKVTKIGDGTLTVSRNGTKFNTLSEDLVYTTNGHLEGIYVDSSLGYQTGMMSAP